MALDYIEACGSRGAKLPSSVTHSTAQNRSRLYLGSMEPLVGNEIAFDTPRRRFESHSWQPEERATFRPLGGLLLASALSLPFWAGVYLLVRSILG